MTPLTANERTPLWFCFEDERGSSAATFAWIDRRQQQNRALRNNAQCDRMSLD